MYAKRIGEEWSSGGWREVQAAAVFEVFGVAAADDASVAAPAAGPAVTEVELELAAEVAVAGLAVGVAV